MRPDVACSWDVAIDRTVTGLVRDASAVLACAVLQRTWLDAFDRSGRQGPARRFLSTPNESLTVWAALAGVDADRIVTIARSVRWPPARRRRGRWSVRTAEQYAALRIRQEARRQANRDAGLTSDGVTRARLSADPANVARRELRRAATGLPVDAPTQVRR